MKPPAKNENWHFSNDRTNLFFFENWRKRKGIWTDKGFGYSFSKNGVFCSFSKYLLDKII